MQSMEVEHLPVPACAPIPGNARTHSRKQIRQIATSIERFGFTNPVLVSDDKEIVAGHGRVEAARLLGRETVPALRLSHLSAAERRAYVLADNKLALNAGWDREVLAIELQALIDLDFDVEVTGFSLAEIDLVLDEAERARRKGRATKPTALRRCQSWAPRSPDRRPVAARRSPAALRGFPQWPKASRS
jgi:ParB-like chromosome segregation protein Spo0J